MAAVNNDPLPPPVSLDPTDPTSPYYDPTIANPIASTDPVQAVVDAEIKADDKKADDTANTVKSSVRRLRTLEQQSPKYIEVQNAINPSNKAVNKKGG